MSVLVFGAQAVLSVTVTHRASALTFAREGALVVGCGLTVEPAEATVEMVEAAGGEMVSMQPCDLTDPADCRTVVDLAVGTFGRIDVLFNLAGASTFNRLEDITDDEWERARRGEVDLVFYLTRAAWPHLKDSGGVVVNMASLNASLSFKILPSLAHPSGPARCSGERSWADSACLRRSRTSRCSSRRERARTSPASMSSSMVA